MLHINLVSISISLLSWMVIATASSIPHGNLPIFKRHHELAKRTEGDVQLFKRVDGARFSFYNTQTGNAGSCGQFLSNSGFTVAVNAAQMNSGLCFKSIKITYNGHSEIATIQDTCPGCPWGGLDLSPGLFSAFAAQSVGIIYGQWEFTDGSGNGGGGDPPKPTTTHKPPPPPPTTTWVPPPPPPPPTTTKVKPHTSTSSPKPTPTPQTSTTSHHSSSSVASSTSAASSSAISSVNYLSGVASGLAIPTGVINVPTSNDTTDSALLGMNNVLIQLGGLVMAANA